VSGLAAAALAAAALSHVAAAQTYAVGVGGMTVYDFADEAVVKGFDTWGGHVFGELRLESSVVLQARLSAFGLRSVAENSPSLRTVAGDLAVGYLFGSEWFRGGLMAGVGAYNLDPRSPSGGQVSHEDQRTEFGWFGGVEAIFDMGRHWDFRLEATGHLIHTEPRRKPVMLGASVAYRF